MGGLKQRTRHDWAPKPCQSCGGPKPPGRGIKRCESCAADSFSAMTLDQLIADQAKELKMGRRVHRQRFGLHSRDRQRTLSLDALEPELWIPAT